MEILGGPKPMKHIDKDRVVHDAHEAAHLSYFVLVFFEGHGLYTWAALALFCAHCWQLCRVRWSKLRSLPKESDL
jgi:hypothetical protein